MVYIRKSLKPSIKQSHEDEPGQITTKFKITSVLSDILKYFEHALNVMYLFDKLLLLYPASLHGGLVAKCQVLPASLSV
jgi:hypothetical protein